MSRLTWKAAFALTGIAAAGIVGLAHLPFRPILNTSSSEPYGLYVVSLFHRQDPPVLHLGERVLFHYIAPKWALGRYYATGTRFLKQVGAVPGEWLFTRKGDQWVCLTDHFGRTCHVLGRMLLKDPKGRVMHWPRWNGYQIPKGEYYMQATYVPISYDSRYYGLVSEYQLIGRLTPVFTFGR